MGTRRATALTLCHFERLATALRKRSLSDLSGQPMLRNQCDTIAELLY